MNKTEIPFNVSILALNEQRIRGLGRITELGAMDGSSKDFHPEGLFSTEFFGRVGDERRNRRFAYIDVKIPVFHPLVYNTLVRLKGLYGEIMAGSEYVVWDEKEKDFVRSSPLEGETGFNFFVKHWKDIDFGKDAKGGRALNIEFLNKVRDVAMTRYVVVMPAGLRELELDEFNRIKEDEINLVYRRILSYSNTITEAGVKLNPQVLDAPRAVIQLAFNTLYETVENLVKGKHKMLLGKWATRRIFNGTRNVITAMDTTVAYLGSKGNPGIDSTILGLFQVMKGALPRAIHDIRKLTENYIPDVTRPASLVDKKTLTRVDVVLTDKTYNQWLTNEGIEKTIERYREDSVRDIPLEVDGHYMALIYKGPDGTVKLLQDIRDLPEGRYKEHVSPVTVTEYLLMAFYKTAGTLPVLVTRYPIIGIGSIYPSRVHLRVKTEFETRTELDENWLPITDAVIYEFPCGGTYVNSLIPHSLYLDGLDAD